MVFTSSLGASAIAVLSALSQVSAVPTPQSSAPNYPPTSLSANFRLIANVTGADLSPSIKNFALTSYHVGAGEDYAVLVANETPTSGRIFYVNGTAEEVRYHSSDILSDEGTPLFPAGVSISSDTNAAGERFVSINAGLGQPSITLTSFPDPISQLAFGSGQFYACNNVMPFGNTAIQLGYRDYDASTPAACVDVNLLAQCSEDSGLAAPFGNTVNCYADVAAIDWTVYSNY